MIRQRMASLDDPAIYRLVVEQLLPFSRTTDRQSVTFPSIRKRLRENMTLVAAKRTGRPFAFISLTIKSKVLYVDMLAVEPGVQGKGWGRKLMEAAEAYGRRKGCRTAQLFVDESNPKAISFYERGHYAMTQYIPHLGCYMMSKALR